MENKKRFELDYDFNDDVNYVLDLEKHEELDMFEVKYLLNEQDEKIKELENFLLLARMGYAFEQEKKNNSLLLVEQLNTLIENITNTVENILNEALKNSSLNAKYYDEILDYLDSLKLLKSQNMSQMI